MDAHEVVEGLVRPVRLWSRPQVLTRPRSSARPSWHVRQAHPLSLLRQCRRLDATAQFGVPTRRATRDPAPPRGQRPAPDLRRWRSKVIGLDG